MIKNIKSIKNIRISFENLTEKEQIEIFLLIFDYSHRNLPHDKNIKIYIETNE